MFRATGTHHIRISAPSSKGYQRVSSVCSPKKKKKEKTLHPPAPNTSHCSIFALHRNQDVSPSPGARFLSQKETPDFIFLGFLLFLCSPVKHTTLIFFFFFFGSKEGVNYLQNKQGGVVAVSQNQTPLSQQQRSRQVYLAGMRG